MLDEQLRTVTGGVPSSFGVWKALHRSSLDLQSILSIFNRLVTGQRRIWIAEEGLSALHKPESPTEDVQPLVWLKSMPSMLLSVSFQIDQIHLHSGNLKEGLQTCTLVAHQASPALC